MPRPPFPAQVDWFSRWLGPRGSHAQVPPGHPAVVALLHPGTRCAADDRFPPYRGPRRGDPGPEQKRLLGRLLLAVSGSRSAATSATWAPPSGLRPQPPLDMATRVRADLDYLVVGGRLGGLVWSTWEPRLAYDQPVTALWPDDHGLTRRAAFGDIRERMGYSR